VSGPLKDEVAKRLRLSLYGLAMVDGVEVESYGQKDSPFLALEAVKTVTVDSQRPIIEAYSIRASIELKLL
jgi:hypothetical protein